MKNALTTIGILIIIAALAVMYMGLDLTVYSAYISSLIGG